jgi:hypothetical protein
LEIWYSKDRFIFDAKQTTREGVVIGYDTYTAKLLIFFFKEIHFAFIQGCWAKKRQQNETMFVVLF